ncbi:unnamed protein product [Dovyalis caffra]|uniref:Uncharacterized protein n=1 Tax=Dovyalis caffra TaxID=77055 RepID=A0AAV1RD82_9ROSI|nr:unnamed protein product [Dovyalis caffra]
MSQGSEKRSRGFRRGRRGFCFCATAVPEIDAVEFLRMRVSVKGAKFLSDVWKIYDRNCTMKERILAPLLGRWKATNHVLTNRNQAALDALQ